MKTFSEEYTKIKIYNKFFGIWFLKDTINRDYGEDGLELFRKTKEHYIKIYGYNQLIKFKLIWDSKTYILNQ